MREVILIVDFDGRYGQRIASRVREAGVYSELTTGNKAADEVQRLSPKGIVLVGGDSVGDDENMPDAASWGETPVLGIDTGAIRLIRASGGEAIKTGKSYGVGKVPEGFSLQAIPEGYVVKNASANQYALLLDLAECNEKVLAEQMQFFLWNVCRCAGGWSPEQFIREATRKLEEELGAQRVLCALSGGVDSSVAATLVHKVIGDRLTCIFVDHGLLRKNERDEVLAAYRERQNLNVICVDARQRFLDKLKGIRDPEQKRKIIGAEFIAVFEEEAARLGDQSYLLQGTIYPDIIESGGDNAAVVKSHHNVGGLPDNMKLTLCEPLRMLFKDEVREVGLALGIQESMVYRQPFPGPGLAVRCLGEVREEKLVIVREADAILREEISKAGLEKTIWQYFALLPNLKSVGVTNGERTYLHTVVLRAVLSVNAMSADYAKIPYDVLDKISKRVISEVGGVNRVVYDITSKPPATIEWE